MDASQFRMKTENDRSLLDYFHWLVSLIDDRSITKGHYEFLLWLHTEEEFYSTLPNDENRAIDGMTLRDNFDRDNATMVYAMLHNEKQSCSMLEFLVALAQRIDYVLLDLENTHQYPKYFWMMVNNLGLHIFKKSDMNVEEQKYLNEKILRRFLERRYTATGTGGLFPLKMPKKDQRNVEIWYQMQSYISEMQ